MIMVQVDADRTAAQPTCGLSYVKRAHDVPKQSAERLACQTSQKGTVGSPLLARENGPCPDAPSGWTPDHPRSRVERLNPHAEIRAENGSPTLARGIGHALRPPQRDRRITHARAWNR